MSSRHQNIPPAAVTDLGERRGRGGKEDMAAALPGRSLLTPQCDKAAAGRQEGSCREVIQGIPEPAHSDQGSPTASSATAACSSPP